MYIYIYIYTYISWGYPNGLAGPIQSVMLAAAAEGFFLPLAVRKPKLVSLSLSLSRLWRARKACKLLRMCTSTWTKPTHERPGSLQHIADCHYDLEITIRIVLQALSWVELLVQRYLT